MCKTIFFSFIMALGLFSCAEHQNSTDYDDDDIVCDFPMPELTYPIVEIETRLGSMHFWLFDETPKHKVKFIQLADREHYDSFTFNRVVMDFVIQGGCPDLPEYFEGSPYLLDPEFVDTITHVYGALAMGRDDNPDKQSNACQFYIVSNEGGIERLDGNYTVFGKIIHGADILEKIEAEPVDETNTPLTDIPLKVSIHEYTEKQLLTDFDFSL